MVDTFELFSDVIPIVEKAVKTRRREAVLHSSKSVEWYTPPRYINAAREVMGGIDLDPASCEKANRNVQATRYYTDVMNGLTKSWSIDGQPSRVWCNPPYGYDGPKCNQARWSAKLIEQYQAGNVSEAILLVNNVADRKWFKPLWNYLMCQTDHRIRFINENGQPQAGTPMGSAFVYFGHQQHQHMKFARIFQQFGHVVCDMNASCAPVHDLWNMEVSA